ncbi:MAG: FapA family protein [Spirochaetaceae bacterium]|jgi:uncharacterized protein (DUF342 family)|nr:FapA family protein [Spirochaetaceae bacterium]
MANTAVIGDVSIFVDEQELEARLFFVPSAGGEEWSAITLDALIRKKQLPSVPMQALEQFLEKAALSREPADMVLCQGYAPVEPVPERIAWAKSPIPDEIEPFAGPILEEAPPPELYRVRTKQVRRERQIRKPGLLGGKETETYWEEEQAQEPVEVDPEVQETRYAERGKTIGTVVPGKPGKSGKNIYGKLLNPGELPEATVLFGAGLEQRGNEIVPTVTGILRLGRGWADVVAIPQPSWSLEMGSDESSLFLSYSPGHALYPRPRAKDILAGAGAPDPALLVDAAELDAELERATRAKEEIVRYPLYREHDASAAVEISPDRSSAALRLRKGSRGRAPLEAGLISQAIKHSGIAVRDGEKLSEIVRDFLEGPETSLLYVFAEGKAPLPGGDEEAEITLSVLDGDTAEAVLERAGKDESFQNLVKQGKLFLPSGDCILAWVDRGQSAVRINQGLPGHPGHTLEGEDIPAPPGQKLNIRLYRGLSLENTEITASQTGLFVAQAGKGFFRAQVLDYRDSTVFVDVADDGMEARVELRGSVGTGAPLTVERVMEALAGAGVKAGIDRPALEAAVDRANRSGRTVSCIAARGLPPVLPGSMELIWLIDMTDWEKPPAVTKDTPLADLIEGGRTGRAGWDLGGGMREIKKGEKTVIRWDASVRAADTETGKRLFANRDGEVAFDGYFLQIAVLREVAGDLAPDSGSLSFSGEIRISGDVLPGCSVSGGRDVSVGGSVRASLVTSGGAVTVGRGVQGRTVINARRGIETPFAEDAILLAVADIQADDRLSGCSIKTNGRVLLRGQEGRLEGGACRARLGVEASALGNEAGVKTLVSFGQDYLVKDRLDQVLKEIERISAALKEPGSGGQNRRLTELDARMRDLRAKFNHHHPSEVRVRGAVWPGVVMESHAAYYVVKERMDRALFWYDEETGQIRVKTPD